jgi:O-antigen ligase
MATRVKPLTPGRGGREGSQLSLTVIHWTYYLFVLSIPFESLPIKIIGNMTVSTMIGFALPLVVWPRPWACFRRPPFAFWCFVVYLTLIAVLALLQPGMLRSAARSQVQTLTQILILFWISYSLMADQRVVERTLALFGGSCALLAVLQIVGITATHEYAGRVSALGENPNDLTTLLSLGLLVLVGLAYGRQRGSGRRRLFAVIGFGFLGAVIVSLGSRGGLLALLVGTLGFLAKRATLPKKLVLLLAGVVILIVLGVASYSDQAMRERWTRTLETGDMAGREKIYPMAWKTFLDRPFLGWGPVRHNFELGSRLGYLLTNGLMYRDQHNVYLWVLDESGLVGGVLFFAGLALCWSAAVRARRGIEGALPVALMICLSVACLKGSYHYRKFFWIVLAYVLASGAKSASRLVATERGSNQDGSPDARFRVRSRAPGGSSAGRLGGYGDPTELPTTSPAATGGRRKEFFDAWPTKWNLPSR